MPQTMKFALFGNTYQERKSAHVTHLLEILRTKGAEICISSEFYSFLMHHSRANLCGLDVFEGSDFSADMVLSIGGDGTFLKAASRVGDRGIPILGINTGRLGFLADISPDQMEEAFEEIYQGRYQAEARRVLQLTEILVVVVIGSHTVFIGFISVRRILIICIFVVGVLAVSIFASCIFIGCGCISAGCA